MKCIILVCFLVLCGEVGSAQESLRGSRPSMEAQSSEAEKHNLSFIPDDPALKRMIKNGYLIAIPETKHLVVDSRLDAKWRFARPWTVAFLKDISSDFYLKFKVPLRVNSAVRTQERQEEIRRRNGNAAPSEGRHRSAHLTGATVDLAKKGHTRAQLKWLQERLLCLEKGKVIEATEEHRQAVFHIMVFKQYQNAKKSSCSTKPDRVSRSGFNIV